MTVNAARYPFDIPSTRQAAGRPVRWRRAAAEWLTVFNRKRRVAAMRRGFANGDARALKDLGISRAQAYFEVDRPIWKGNRLLTVREEGAL